MTRSVLSRAAPQLTILVTSLIGVTLATSALAQSATRQQQSEPDALAFTGSLALGAEHSTNLNVSELESAAGSADTATKLDGKLDMNWKAVERLTVTSGYSYSGSRYRDFNEYDLDLNLLYADAAYQFDLLTLGTNYYFADARLGDDGFLRLNQYSVYAGKLFSERWYLRGALNFNDKEFDVFNARDADNESSSVELYRFFNSGRSNVTLGYTNEDEDTRGPAFDYTADSLRLRLNHRFMLSAREARLLLGYRWQDRDYSGITPLINLPRDDSQTVTEARLEVDIVEGFAVVGGWEHADYDSRLPTAVFTNNRVTLAVQASF